MISFKWRHFQKELVLLVIRWYLSYSLSYRDIEEMMLERSVKVDHSTINRWVIYYAPLLEAEFTKHSKRKVSSSWRVDETYIKVKGKWCYLYRAVDKEGNTIDFMLSKNRDKASANTFFEKAINTNGIPEKVTIDKSGSNKAGLEEINFQLMIIALMGYALMQIEIRQIKYLNNIIEQDHRGIKRITNPMMGFKSFHSADATLAGIELCRMLKKDQHINSENMPAFEQFYSLAAQLRLAEVRLYFFKSNEKFATEPFLLPLLEEGFNIQGFDASESMLNQLRNKASLKNLIPTVWKGFVEDLKREESYDLIFIPSGSICLITEPATLKLAFKILFDHLSKGGILLFEIDTMNAVPPLDVWRGSVWNTPDGDKIILSQCATLSDQICHSVCKYELVRDNSIISTEIEEYMIKTFNHNELMGMLTQVGFKKVCTMKAFDRAVAPSDIDESIVYECIK